MNQYEAMFIFDPNVGTEFSACETEVKRLVDRAGGELQFCKKWDERRLAYRIKGRKRGIYVLTYFNAPPESIAAFNRDAQISESILRVLVVRADGVTPEMMENFVTARGGSMTPSDERGGGDDNRPSGDRPSRDDDRRVGAGASSHGAGPDEAQEE